MTFTQVKFIVVALLCILLCSDISAQQDSLILTIEQARAQEDFEVYYKSVSTLERHFIDQRDLEELYDHHYYSYKPKSLADSLTYRKYNMLHAYRLYRHLGDIHMSLEFYLIAHKHLPSYVTNDKQVYFTEKAIASHYARLDDYDKSLWFASLVEKYLKHNKLDGKLGRLYSDIGELHLWKLDTVSAIRYFKDGMDLGYSSKNDKAIVANQTSLAKLYLDNKDYSSFEKLYNQIQSNLSKLDTSDINYFLRVGEIKMLQSNYLSMQGKFKEAQLELNSIIAIYKKNFKGTRVREIAKMFLAKGSLALEQGRLNEAQQYYLKGLEWIIGSKNAKRFLLQKKAIPENTLVDLAMLKFKIYEAEYEAFNQKSKLDSSLLALEKALNVDEWIYKDLLSTETRLLSNTELKLVLSEEVGMCHRLWSMTKDTIYLDKAYKSFLKSKAVLLNQRRAERSAIKLLPQADRDSIKSFERYLLQRLELYSSQLEPEESLAEEIYHAKEKIEIFKRNILGKSIDEGVIDSPFVEYFWTDNAIYILDNISSEPFRKIEIVNEIDQLISTLLNSLESKTQDYLISLEKLSELLLPANYKHQDQLTIIPDGKLLLLPLDMLFENSSADSRVNYTFSRRKISAAPQLLTSNSLLVLAPKYLSEADIEGVREGFSELNFAELEADELVRSMKGKAEKITNCDLSSLEDYSYEYNIFHYAGHAMGSGKSPSLILVDKDGQKKYLTNNMLEEANLNFDLVTLSACETGMGQFVHGEGVRSLAHAFLSAGAKHVIYSLWSVNDKTTATLMTLLYAELEKGGEVSEALRSAKVQFLETASPSERHPYYWSGFVCVGDEVGLPKKNHSIKIYILIGIIILSFIILYIKSKTL